MNRGARRAVAAVLVLLAAWEVGRSLVRIDLVVFHDYLRVGQVVQHGDPYATLSFDTWPPFFILIALVLTELARVSRVGALVIWQLWSVAALWGACRLLPRLAGEAPEPLTSAATLVPLVMMARLVQEHLESTQINLYLLFLVLLAFVLFRRRRDAMGGLARARAALVTPYSTPWPSGRRRASCGCSMRLARSACSHWRLPLVVTRRASITRTCTRS